MHNYPLVVDIYQGTNNLDSLIKNNKVYFSKDIIKDCTLTFIQESIRERFPNAQFVFVSRDPRDNIRSILDRLDLPGNKRTLELHQYDNISEIWNGVIEGKWMNVQGATYIERLAERWRRAATLYLEHESNTHLIRYEDFLSGKVESINGLALRLGLSQKNPIEKKVDQQFQPRGKRRNMDWLSVYGERNLERIEKRCRAPMRALGYDDFRVASV